MGNEKVVAYDPRCAYPHKRICWTAIFTGAIVGVGLTFLINLFGIAIGLTAFNVGKDGAMALAIGGFIGFVIAIVVTMLIAGYVAGYLGRHYAPKRNLGLLYGFTTWCVALFIGAVLAGHVNHYASDYANSIGGSTVIVSENEGTGVDTIAVETSSSSNKKQNVTKVSTPEGTIATGAFVLFALFLIGAISSCVGASWSMTCNRDD